MGLCKDCAWCYGPGKTNPQCEHMLRPMKDDVLKIREDDCHVINLDGKCVHFLTYQNYIRINKDIGRLIDSLYEDVCNTITIPAEGISIAELVEKYHSSQRKGGGKDYGKEIL